MRVISVGVSRVFRLVELDGGAIRVEQAVKSAPDLRSKRKWMWRPLAMVNGLNAWVEAHGALHQMQADFGDELLRRQAMAKRMEKTL